MPDGSGLARAHMHAAATTLNEGTVMTPAGL